jgi:hypothetical protein
MKAETLVPLEVEAAGDHALRKESEVICEDRKIYFHVCRSIGVIIHL